LETFLLRKLREALTGAGWRKKEIAIYGGRGWEKSE